MLPISLSTTTLFPRGPSDPESLSVLGKGSLSPLPPSLFRGLTAVSIFAFLSFFLSIALFLRLTYRLILDRRHKLHRNQFLVLILNLLLADIQQSIAFWSNVQWLRHDGIQVDTSMCWAQGFFVSVGDLASGVFTIAIAVHTFADIVLAYQPGYGLFLGCIASCHVFVYACAVIGIALHPADIYVRAGAWCWVNGSYQHERLWLHYFWILVAEFGTVLLYSALFWILQQRLRSNYYSAPGSAGRAKAAARAIIPYPIIYVVCTCPLAAMRISSMADNVPSYVQLCVAAAMITSNGWLDVLLYSLTRRALIFGSEPLKEDMRALDTFYWKPEEYGTTTTIQGGAVRRSGSRGRGRKGLSEGFDERSSSTEELVDLEDGAMKMKTEVTVSRAPIELQFVKKQSVGARSEEDQKSSMSKGSFFRDEF
ncbi:G protein-coupled glucose receptor regulating Gpa2-domain-containing protein [Elsinoe ampelina]|uniref:G protein-coupled glucose receptor regulating Gpa2-domain-containing protein n=1 Tax=Elsinoe ampelina TaxID=302913 RepID=A0A6A6G378_9PEZI|nr:G protein-coupled glucose receptor regulating Gpa2-domain-containing protein [Elsinoe ampelina]